MNKLNQIAIFFIKDAIENNYSVEEITIAIKLQYNEIVSALIINQINYITSK